MELIIETLRSVSYAIVDPTLALMLLIVGILFYLKNRKISFMQRLVMGERVTSPLELTLSQIVIGIFGGVVASVILTLLGVTFYENSGVEYLFLISVFLMVYKPKIFNFPYSAAILGGVSIILSMLKLGQDAIINVNITHLITLISVIMFVQGILIIIDGRKGYIPVFTNRNNKILGGFAFKRYWALPIAFFIAVTSISTPLVGQNIVTPSWWPIIKSSDIIALIATAALAILPMYGVVGYDEVTFTKSKMRKTITSGLFTIVYSIVLLAVGQLAQLGLTMEIVAIILMLLLYEVLKYVEKKFESLGLPMYISDDEGICVLDVIPNSLAFQQGVRSGDKIIEVDGVKPNNESEVFTSIKDGYLTTILKIRNLQGEIKEYIITEKSKTQRFGIVLVPRDQKNKEKYNVQEILDKIKSFKGNH